MNFRTEVRPKESAAKIELTSKLVSFGSCFADTMGGRFSDIKLKTLVNPFGVIYNPLSVLFLIKNSLQNNGWDDEGFIERDGIWYHDQVHTSISANSKDELKDQLNRLASNVSGFLKEADCFILTPGTATVYEYLSNGRLVANCHKLPAATFEKRLLAVKEIVDAFIEVHTLIKSVNPTIQILMTISPFSTSTF